MKRLPLNRAQRVVTVVGLGAALYVLGQWLMGLDSSLPRGWVAYAPMTGQIYDGGLHPWVRLVIWVLLIAVWAGTSAILLKSDHPL